MSPRATTFLACSAVGIAAAHTACRQIGRTWGASAVETKQSLPGDELVPQAESQATMAIDIDAPPEFVWPWLVQMGVDRAGLYTHLWVENGLLRLGVKNASEIVQSWQDLDVGDHIWFVPRKYFTPQYGPLVVRMERNQVLACTFGDDPARIYGTWQFILRPQGSAATRLLFRSRASRTRPTGTKLFDLIVEPGYLYMDIGMLHGIKVRAERQARQEEAKTQPLATVVGGRPRTVLVAVASRQGSTRQIAREIAAQLRTHGVVADVRNAADVSELTGYDAIVLGSAIHIHRWLPEAEAFITRHRAALKTRPVWLFSSGMLAVDKKTSWEANYPQSIDKMRAAVGAREHKIFTGRRQMEEPKAFWKPFLNVFTKMSHFNMTLGDYRDWDAIQQWARTIATALAAERQVAAD